MPWLKMDDGMGEHRKTKRALRDAGLGVMGLHALALLHAAKYLTDGWIEDEFVEETFLLAGTRPAERRRVLATLEERGMWVRGDGGWLIHDYLEYNPSRAQVEAERARTAERKRAWRERQAAKGNGRVPRPETRDGRCPDPTRPDPTRPDPPLPPHGGDSPPPMPVKPTGRRKTEWQAFDGQVLDLARWMYPDADPEMAYGYVRSAVANGATTPAAVRIATDQWLGEES